MFKFISSLQFYNCRTRILADDRHCLACDNNSPEVLNMQIIHEEIDKVISNTYNRKSPGPDGCVVELFKNSTENNNA